VRGAVSLQAAIKSCVLWALDQTRLIELVIIMALNTKLANEKLRIIKKVLIKLLRKSNPKAS
jgi:hypothetical protein